VPVYIELKCPLNCEAAVRLTEVIMKKFIIVIVFLFLIAILISFNYLLWDREKQLESYQDMSDSNNLTIDTLSERMNTLDKLNKELNKRIENLTSDNSTIREYSSSVYSENVEIKKDIIEKESLISVLKKNLNISPMDAVIKKWTDAVNAKNYAAAQALVSKDSKDDNIRDLAKFKEAYRTELKSIKIKSLKLFTELNDSEHLEKLQFKVVFEVVKLDKTDDSTEKTTDNIFKSGDNEKIITMEFNSNTNEWLISEIEDKP
jgi:cell division protein FtsB